MIVSVNNLLFALSFVAALTVLLLFCLFVYDFHSKHAFEVFLLLYFCVYLHFSDLRYWESLVRSRMALLYRSEPEKEVKEDVEVREVIEVKDPDPSETDHEPGLLL